MKLALLIALLATVSPANAQIVSPPKDSQSVRDQLKADRSKYKEEFDSSSKKRPWDRDKNGERPFERKEDPLPKD